MTKISQYAEGRGQELSLGNATLLTQRAEPGTR